MSTLLLTIIFIGILGVVIMIIYLIDRVNAIERATLAQHGSGMPGDEGPRDPRFAGLEGERLWQAMTGTAIPAGWNAETVQDLREPYAAILQRHIEELFEEGVLDGRQGIQMHPGTLRSIRGASGVVHSWLPDGSARALYDIGRERSMTGTSALGQLRERLDEISQRLFESTGMRRAPRLSRILMPGTPASAEDLGEVDEDGNAWSSPAAPQITDIGTDVSTPAEVR